MSTKIWNTDLVGVLPTEDYVNKTIDKESIYPNSQDIMQFSVRIISTTPRSFPDVKLITCFGSDLIRWGFEDNRNASREERINAVRDFLTGNLIVFKPQRKTLYDHTEVFSGFDLRLLQKSEKFEGSKLTPLPIFSQEVHGHKFDEFIKKLQSKKPIGQISNFSTEANDTPEFVIWKKDQFEYMAIGEFTNHYYAKGGFCFTTERDKKLKAVQFIDEWIDESYEMDNVLYLSNEIYVYLSGAISAADSLDELLEWQEESHGMNTVKKEIASAVNKEGGGIVTLPRLDEAVSFENLSEEFIMKNLIQTTIDQGLVYDYKDLYNFHTAMKSSNLVILAGMSGTGKSKLVHAYGRALGLEAQLKFVSVRPSWTDDADLLGYADTMNKIYRQGDSGLVDVLIEAEENREKLYIICFDEMNLARVEHYFSQFLSVLEMESGPQKTIRLYNDQLESLLENAERYPPSIPIGDNVIFVGTVNLDESTYHFSDKVLDRANVISLKVMPFTNLRSMNDKNDVEQSSRFEVSFSQFESFKRSKGDIALSESELNLLWEIHVELQKVNKNLGAGPRIVRQIDRYLKNLPNNDYLTRRQAIDLQLVQRILTKVRGPEEQLKPLLGFYDFGMDQVEDSKLADILDQHSLLSDFEETRKVLLHKAKELKINGYSV